MTFASLVERIHQKSSGYLQDSVVFEDIDGNQWLFILYYLLENNENSLGHKNHLIVANTVEEAERTYEKFKGKLPQYNICLFPGLEHSPYLQALPSEKNLLQRFSVYHSLALFKGLHIIITTREALFLKGPSKDFFLKFSFSVKTQGSLPPEQLASLLIERGYRQLSIISEPGTFAKRGEIFDINPIGGPPIRLHYYDDIIEKIFHIDMSNQKTLRNKTVKRVLLGPSPYIFFMKQFQKNFSKRILKPAYFSRKKYLNRQEIFERLKQSEIFEEFPYCASLFVEGPTAFCNYFCREDTVIHFLNPQENPKMFFETLEEEYEKILHDGESGCVLPSPENFYSKYSEELLKNFCCITLSSLLVSQKYSSQVIRKMLQHINFLFFVFFQKDSLENFKEFIGLDKLDEYLKNKILFSQFSLERGFFCKEDNILVLSDSDVFGYKTHRVQKRVRRNQDFFVEQFSHLKEGDWVIHADYGVGRYLGLKHLEREGGGDFLIIGYRSEDKVYVPIYGLNLIQKYADASSERMPDSLRSKRFSQIKSKARQSAKKLAFDLLKLQAKRQLQKAFAFSPPDEEYKIFEEAFPFIETADQALAINDVLEDMQKDRPMERLICGDVGFGKTEVAMRAAFKAVLDHKQVAVIVPTTILAFQHYGSFKTRFENIPVNINFLSRFHSLKESKEIRNKLKIGGIDIIIGTHKILSSNIEFLDIGLVIVDEEHRFGVSHKERLKLLKPNVDFLSLTATPIPRTLQLSLLGLRDLSLISTPPPKRQSIKTTIIKENNLFIKKAIEDELSREGQVFIVYNRIQTIGSYSAEIQKLVPEAKITFVHGKLHERELEKRMNAFCQKHYNVLIATTIIESGLDIPNANTIIVERADTYGLSQLYQLRGRIGRSERKAYCYFVIPDQKLTPTATKRLNALQSYGGIGLGFHLANADLDIRGAGDILGAGQSGHINSIGLELYMKLLKEAVAEIKGEFFIEPNVEITTPFPSFIPKFYIENSSIRLKYYKRLSSCSSLLDLRELCEEIEDIFGTLPKEFINLITLLKVRINLTSLGVCSLKVTTQSIILKLDKNILDRKKDIRSTLVAYFLQRPEVYKLTPDNRVIFSCKRNLDIQNLLDFSVNLKEKIISNK